MIIEENNTWCDTPLSIGPLHPRQILDVHNDIVVNDCDPDAAVHIVACVNALRGFDPQEARMKALAWDLYLGQRILSKPYHIDGEGWFVVVIDTDLETGPCPSAHEAMCWAAIYSEIEMDFPGGKRKLTEEDLHDLP